MSQAPPPPPPPPPPFGASRPPAPTVVHVVSRPGGFLQAVLFVIAILLFAGVFFGGVVIGIGTMVAAGRVDSVVVERSIRDAGPQRIAVIPVTGTIDGANAAFVQAAVRHVLKDASIDAVVLRVNSPGGGVSASDQIWHEMGKLRKSRRPVIASFGGVAASGGYYVACGSDAIVAEPTTVTGSIGVIAQIFTMSELMTKVGVQPVTLVAQGSPEKDVANDVFREWTPADRDSVMTMLDAAYDTFNLRVREGRSNVIDDPERIDELADGSVFTAAEALETGLVDQIGYLDDAIAVAEQQAGIAAGRATVVRLGLPPSLFGNGLLLQQRVGAELDAERIRSTFNDLAAPRVMYLMH